MILLRPPDYEPSVNELTTNILTFPPGEYGIFQSVAYSYRSRKTMTLLTPEGEPNEYSHSPEMVEATMGFLCVIAGGDTLTREQVLALPYHKAFPQNETFELRHGDSLHIITDRLFVHELMHPTADKVPTYVLCPLYKVR